MIIFAVQKCPTMKKLLTTLCLMLAWTALAGVAKAQTENEKPLLTIACISDIHTERSLIDCANLNDIALRGSFIKTLAQLKNTEKIDVMLLGGDCTSDATIPVGNWQQVRKLIAQYTRRAFPTVKSTPVIYVTGNHDYEVANLDNIPKPYNAGDYYTFPMKDDIGELTADEAFYEDADNGNLGKMTLLAAFHYVINGFDFVVLNCGKNFFKSAWDYVYSEESVQWVADKLAEIYADNPDKTVFFALHIPFSDSNSIREPSKGIASSPGEKLLKKTLSKYPNLIMLYGHDHGGDKAYTRRKTSQRVTHYDRNGNPVPGYCRIQRGVSYGDTFSGPVFYWYDLNHKKAWVMPQLSFSKRSPEDATGIPYNWNRLLVDLATDGPIVAVHPAWWKD